MPKSRDKNSDEHYKGIIRELTKENRALKKENKQLKRSKHMYTDFKILSEIAEEAETVVAETKKGTCPQCKDGIVFVALELEDKIIHACDECFYRKAVKR